MSDQSTNPFAPKGLRQAAESREGNAFRPTGQGDQAPAAEGTMNPFAPRSWYTGANMESTENGYNTPFYQKFFEQQETLSKQGKLLDFFNQKDATGVVTWDHGKNDTGVAGPKFKFGDVYEDGRFVANVYDTYDKNTADLLMADLTLDADTKARAYRTGNPESIGKAVDDKRKTTETESGKWLTQQEFQQDVEKQHENWANPGAQSLTVAGGAAGGAAVGAGIGSVVPVVGTAAGAVVGGALGAFGAWLNQDELIGQAARAKVQTDMAEDQFGQGAAFFAGLQGWGGLGMKAISPTSNLFHGAYDATNGGVGDKKASWYDVDETGQRKRSGLMQGLDVGASVIDAAGQFGSASGALLFQGSMGTTIAGSVGSLGASGGYTFDDRAGVYDLITRDDDGNFDLGALSAGIGSIGIDALQMGMARGLTSSVMSQGRVAKSAVGETAASSKLSQQLNTIASGSSSRVHVAGFSYKLDDAGRAIEGSRRASLSILAPSEGIQGLSASMRARRIAATEGGALNADTFYRAASEMATGSRRWNAALVNGFGEGTEEVAQAILEPISHNSRATAEEIVDAGLQGFAMGFGMSLGAGGRGVSSNDKLYAQAYVTRAAMGMGELSRSEWNGMSDSAQRAATMAPPYVQELAKEAARKIADSQRTTAVSNTAALEKYVDAAQMQLAREAGKLTSRTDGAFVITQLQDAGMVDEDGNVLPGSMPSYAVGSSLTTLITNFGRRMEGTEIARDSLAEDDPMRAVYDSTLAEAEILGEFLVQAHQKVVAAMQAGATEAVRTVVDDVNDTIRQWYGGTGEVVTDVGLARMRAVSHLFIRDPQDQSGSYQLLMPQSSQELTLESADNVLQVSHGILQAIGGDFDGDKTREQAQLILDPAKFANIRTGMNLLGAMGKDGTSVNIMTRPYETYEITVLANAMNASGAIAAEANGTLVRIREAIETRYAKSAIPAADLARVLDRFVRDIRADDGKARARLIDSLAEFGAEMSEFARARMSNEWLWVDQVVQANLQRFQRINASHIQLPGEINTTRKPPIAQTTQFREVAAAAAASDVYTMSLRAGGASLFRMFQKLHYSSGNAPVEGTTQWNTDQLNELTAFYELLSQDMTRTAVEALESADEIMGRVQFQLRALAADARVAAEETKQPLALSSAFALTANALMPYSASDGTIHTGTSVTQALLAREITRFETISAAAMTPELKSKLARYKRLTRPGQAEQAFVEVLGQVQLYELMGPSAQALGSNLSVEQFVRQYVNQSEAAKQDTARMLKLEPEYLGRESKQDLPYTLDEVSLGSLSAYRSVVDSMIAAGNRRLTIDDAGLAKGELADRSNTYQQTLIEAFGHVQQAIREVEGFRRGFNRKNTKESQAWLANLMDTNPDWARSVIALIPDSAVNAVMTVTEKDGVALLTISPWVYEMLVMTDPAEAAMHYWRSVTMARWASQGSNNSAEATDDKARTFMSLDSRFQKLLYRVGQTEDGGIRMARMMTRMAESKSLDEFFKFVNKEMRGSEAPYMPWIDDVAELSPDKASGGLSSALPGALMREAILNFQDRSDRLSGLMAAERARDIADDKTMTALARAIEAGDKATPTDKALLARAQSVLDFTKDQKTTLGPGAMKAQTAGSLLHFWAQAHTKGISPWPYVPIGAFEALGDSLGFETPFGQHEAALVGTQDPEDIGTNMPMLARDSVQSMTADGTTISWDQLTLENVAKIWMDNPTARPAIRAILFPSVFEKTMTGQVTQQFLTPLSITELFDKQVYEDLFRQTNHDKQVYLSMVESRSRRFGGNYPVMRLANDLVIARTSALRQTLTPLEAERMTDEAYEEIAEVLQIVGELAALDPTTKNVAISDLRERLQDTIRKQRVGAMLGLQGEKAQVLTDLTIETLLNEKRREVAEAIIGVSAEVRDKILDDFDQVQKKIAIISSGAPFQQVQIAFTIPWESDTATTAKQSEIVEYVRTHPGLMQKAVWAMTEISQITAWLGDADHVDALPPLKKGAWDTVSKAIIAAYLDDMATDTADNVAVPVYPELEQQHLLRYMDPTYSYLLDDLLDAASPMVQAAAELHIASGRRGVRNATGSLVDKIMNTIFNPKKLGPWTSDIPRLSIEASHSRLPAAAAAQGVAMAGLSPRRQATESAATRRTFALPAEEAFGTAVLTLDMLVGNQSSTIIPTLLQGQAAEMPLMRLNGRFARGASVEYVDEAGETQTVDLWSMAPILGRPHLQDEGAANSGLRSFTVNQLINAVGRAIPTPVTDAKISIDFVHPDAQPAEGYAHNLFFEGTSFELDADGMDSLNATLWFAPGGLSPDGQAKALQANKTGKQALSVTPVPTSSDVANYEAGWETNFSMMLQRKAMYLVSTDLGSGRLQPTFFNSIFRRQKIRHFVRGINAEGQAELWSANQVIAFQTSNPGVALPLTQAELWKPTERIVRSMLGEHDAEGALIAITGLPELDISKIPVWDGLGDSIAMRMPGALAQNEDGTFKTADLLSTPAAQRTFQSQLSIPPALTRDQLKEYGGAIATAVARKTEIHAARQMVPGFESTLKSWGGRATSEAIRQLGMTADGIDLRDGGLAFIGPRNPQDTAITAAILGEMNEVLQMDGLRAAWTFIFGQQDQRGPLQGVLNEVSIANTGSTKTTRHLQVAPQDVVVVNLDSAEETYGGLTEQTVRAGEAALTHMMKARATIAIPDGITGGELRYHMTQFLRESGYRAVPGSKHLFQPIPSSEVYANPQARMSTLAETYAISAQSRVAIFHSQDFQIAENGAWILNPGEHHPVALAFDLVPSNLFERFNVPIEASQVQAVQATVANLDDAAKTMLYTAMGTTAGTPEALEFDAALQRLLDNWDADPTNPKVTPRRGAMFGTGDIIPLLDTKTGDLLLLRHGHDLLSETAIRDQLLSSPIDGERRAGIAVSPTTVNSAHTTRRGEVLAFEPRSQYGLSAQLRIPLQEYGDKLQLEGLGMKLVTSEIGSGIEMPAHGLFPGWHLDLAMNWKDATGKESYPGMSNNHRNAIAYFGADFRPDLVKSLFGKDLDSLTAEDRVATLNNLNDVLLSVRRGREISLGAASDILRMSAPEGMLIDLLSPLDASALANGWTQRLADANATPEDLITRAIIVYLMTPQAQVEHVLESGGFNNPDARTGNGKSIMMPPLFTDALDRAPFGSALRKHMNKKFNDQIDNPRAEQGKQTGYQLGEDFRFHIVTETGTYTGWLQFAEVHSSGDNPVTNALAFARSTDQKISPHSIDIAFQAVGARTAIPKKLDKTRAWIEKAGIETWENEGALWDLIRDVPRNDTTYKQWREYNPAELEYKSLGREAVTAFRREISTEGWTNEDVAAFQALRNEVALAYGLSEKQAGIVDYWVRQMLGQPLDPENADNGRITFDAAMDTMRLEVLWNAQHGYLPVHGAEVPQLHYNDLNVLHRVAQSPSAPFKLKEGLGSTSTVTSWDDWVHVALAVGETETENFDPMFRLATDGFLHTYLDSTEALAGLPVSRSRLQQELLFDPETTKVVLSIDPNQNALLSEPGMMDAERATFSALMGGQRSSGGKTGLKSVPASVRSRRDATRRRWRKENSVPSPMPMNLRNFRENGAQFLSDSTSTNALMRIAVNLRVGNALFNPFLWVSAIGETLVRGGLEDATNMLMGDSTGAVGQLTSRYSKGQLKKFRQLSQGLGRRTEFKGMIYRELMFQQERLSNAGRIERWTHNFARFGSSIQDPTYGMRGDTLARRYLESVLAYMASTPMDTTITPDTLVAHLTTNPTWVRDNMPEAHEAATATIANVRQLKATPLSLALRGIYEPLSKNPNMLINMPSTLFLKLPLMFSTYGMNVLTNVLGLQGASAATAMFLEGRNKGWIGRLQASMEGREFNEETDSTFDMSEVLEGLDLSKTFIQSGLTHTSLFAMGMLAGGLGLSGESEEDKRRRRAAKFQGAGYVFDPRKIENDFRNADAIFLDWLPFGLSSMFRVTNEDSPSGEKSMANLHWMMKQFVSPIMGMEKFFETGDVKQIVWGFQEAINSFPLINSAMWSDAVTTFAELSSSAKDHEVLGTPDDLSTSYDFMLKGMWTMEKMLFENSFVNMLYVGTDKYDRDPWVLPEVDAEGNIMRDRLDIPRPSKALQDYVDPVTGEVASGYVGRDWWDAQLHGFTENRATLAFMSSLFTGFSGSTYLRDNMAAKTRVLKKPELSQEEAEGLILSAWDSADRTIITEVDGKQYVEGGAEVLTEHGARAVFQGLWKGSVALGDKSLEGVFIPFQMRNDIQAKWMSELVQEGIDAGLTESKAKSRMYNIWYGPSTDPNAVGLKDILWSSDISYARDIRYNQLNTTYVLGPDGRPWATGATRDSLMNAFGAIPLNRFYAGDVGNLGVDSRLNSVDGVAGLNTGLRALEKTDESWLVPTPEEIGESIEKAITKAMADSYAPNNGYSSGYGNGYTPWGRSGYSRRSYGGGGGYSSGGTFSKLNSPQDSNVSYDNAIPFINTSNPIIRRATIRRERFDSDRGRLNQWQ